MQIQEAAVFDSSILMRDSSNEGNNLYLTVTSWGNMRMICSM